MGLSQNNQRGQKEVMIQEGTQIDLLISRNDNVMNMCKIKYYSDEFAVNKEYYQVLLHRQEILAKEILPVMARSSIRIWAVSHPRQMPRKCFIDFWE